MGWKNVKQHYGIKHMVRVEKKGICIGSQYVHDLIVIANRDPTWDERDSGKESTCIAPDLYIWRLRHLGRGEPFDGWVQRMTDDPATLRRLIDTPDTFAKSITVYTYDLGEIITCQCEELGWPNITHDGRAMYENLFSTDRAQVVAWAKKNATAGIESIKRTVADAEAQLADRKKWLAEYEAALKKLEAA